MGADDDADCVEHVWQLAGLVLTAGGSHTEYRCVRCPAVLAVGPGEEHPQTV